MYYKTKLNVCRFIQKGQEIFSDYNYALEVCWIFYFSSSSIPQSSGAPDSGLI